MNGTYLQNKHTDNAFGHVCAEKCVFFGKKRKVHKCVYSGTKGTKVMEI